MHWTGTFPILLRFTRMLAFGSPIHLIHFNIYWILFGVVYFWRGFFVSIFVSVYDFVLICCYKVNLLHYVKGTGLGRLGLFH